MSDEASNDPRSGPRRRLVSGTHNADGTFTFGIFGTPDDTGKASVADSVTISEGDVNESLRRQLMFIGVQSIASNAYTRLKGDDQTPENVKAVFDKLLPTLRDGTWTPGRSFEAGEPDDIVVAIAEATSQPIHVVQDHVDNDLVRTPTGEPVKDKRGRNKRVYTQATLDKIAKDPRVAPIMARLANERAKRLTAEARNVGKSTAGDPSLLTAFGTGSPMAEAAK